MTPRQIELARHALGLDGRRVESYRNHFVAGKDHDDFGEWIAMCAAGLARRRVNSRMAGGDDVFWLTIDGATAALKPGEKLDPEDFPEQSTSIRGGHDAG